MGARCGVGATAALLALASCGGSSDATSGVTVTDAWARTSPSGATTGAAYFTMSASSADVLVGASVETSVASTTELHSTMTDASSGTAAMEAMGSLDVPSGEDVTFEPGGTHLMLVDLAQPLVDGDAFELTLTFEETGAHVITVEVRDEAP